MFAVEKEYTKEILSKILKVNGEFNKERNRLLKYSCGTFIPKLPNKLSKDDYKTIVDLAIFSGFVTLILPENPYINGLKKRGIIYGLKVLMVNEGNNEGLPGLTTSALQ